MIRRSQWDTFRISYKEYLVSSAQLKYISQYQYHTCFPSVSNPFPHFCSQSRASAQVNNSLSVGILNLQIVSLLTKPETKRASQNVQGMANHIRENLDAAGYDVDTSGLPVVSIRVGKESLLMEFADQLQG